MHPTGSGSDDFELQQCAADSPISIPEIQGDPDGPTRDDTWVLEFYDQANRGPFLSTSTVTINPSVAAEIIQILCSKPIEEIPLHIPPLSPDLQNHPCRVFTAFLRGLIYEAGAPGWGAVLAEMSHLVFQHIKVQSVGATVSDTLFSHVLEVAMIRLARSPFRPETGTFHIFLAYRLTHIRYSCMESARRCERRENRCLLGVTLVLQTRPAPRAY